MTKWMRRTESDYLENLARKARRRGDPAEAARWYKTAAAREANIARWQTLIQRDITFEQQQADRERTQEQAAQKNAPPRPNYFRRRMHEIMTQYDAENGTNEAERYATYTPPEE